MLERPSGLPTDMPVCYVELGGNFTWYSPATPQAPRGTALTFHTAFRVFDAKTGNLIVIGAPTFLRRCSPPRRRAKVATGVTG